MPQLLGNILAVNKHELIGPELFPSYDALKKKLYRDKHLDWGMRRVAYGGNGRKLLVNYDTLPKRYQAHIPDPRKIDHILQNYYKTDKAAVAYYNTFIYPDGTHLLPNTVDKLIINASILTAIIALEADRITERQSKNSSTRGILKTLFEDAHSFNIHLKKHHGYGHNLNSSIKRFSIQLKSFKIHSYSALIKDSKGHAKKNAQVRTEELNDLLKNLLAGRTHKPTPTQVAKEYEAFIAGYINVINKKTGEVINPEGYKPLNKRAITKFLASWDSKIGTDAKRVGSNRQPLIGQYIPSHSFKMPTMSGSMITIDDRQPPFHYNTDRDRMWWYLGFDMASEAIVAWAYGKTKRELITNFYRNMVANHHNWGVQLPAEVECETSLNISFKDSFLKEGNMFEYVTMYRNMARSKRAERFFRELRYSENFEKGRLGWIARPHSKSEPNQEGPNQAIIPYDDLVQQCFEDIIQWNNMPKKGSTQSRFDYYLQTQNPDLITTNYHGFIKDLGTLRKTSCKSGIVRLNRSDWLIGEGGTIYTGEKLINQLKHIEQKTLKIYYLDDDQGNIIKAYAFNLHNERYLCELLPKPKYQKSKKEKTEADKQAASIMSAYVNTIAVYQRSQKNRIEPLEVINNKPVTVSSSFRIAGITKSDIPEAETNLTESHHITQDDLDNYEYHTSNPAEDL